MSSLHRVEEPTNENGGGLGCFQRPPMSDVVGVHVAAPSISATWRDPSRSERVGGSVDHHSGHPRGPQASLSWLKGLGSAERQRSRMHDPMVSSLHPAGAAASSCVSRTPRRRRPVLGRCGVLVLEELLTLAGVCQILAKPCQTESGCMVFPTSAVQFRGPSPRAVATRTWAGAPLVADQTDRSGLRSRRRSSECWVVWRLRPEARRMRVSWAVGGILSDPFRPGRPDERPFVLRDLGRPGATGVEHLGRRRPSGSGRDSLIRGCTQMTLARPAHSAARYEALASLARRRLHGPSQVGT
jgi:hypothetical protein